MYKIIEERIHELSSEVARLRIEASSSTSEQFKLKAKLLSKAKLLESTLTINKQLLTQLQGKTRRKL